ncbi:NAD(P)H-dependent oxidoreductase [Actinomadura barringtoniae]|uniref:NAD(P)H-dependent oxidoreductase n=1 Tax=Actinomadura barringtoniae TaxID=1427535 RepID=A0A939P8M6_9ACTN|nr:NAD(P)H-dependent oxidoreductase [Actinomadura barringtoniae]MBO2447941.1 NAD(P)H-dependent oxidoreductase [Actinomadura barringtoniae]
MAKSLVTLVGNPRAGSRTHQVARQAAQAIADRIGHTAADEIVDLSAVAPHLLAATPAAAVEVSLDLVRGADVLVVASPTYKGTYTGLLKAFLDLVPTGALASTVALPLLVMGDAKHALAVEVHLRPLLLELGAQVPTPGAFLLESQLPQAEELLGAWADRVAPQVTSALTSETLTSR